MTNELMTVLILALIFLASVTQPSLSGVERELRRIADALEKLERKQ